MQEYRYNSEFGLRHNVDKTTLLPLYRCDVNMNQVIGRLDPQGAMRLGEKTREEFERNNMLQLMSSASIF